MSKSGKILIVEDEVELAEIFSDYLMAEDFAVAVTHTGAGVVESVRESPPDLLLLDLMLPEVDGVTICTQIRKFSSVPIIMVTAKVDEIDRLLGLDIGADDYICKPAKPREVVARVKAVLRRAGRDDEEREASFLELVKTDHSARWNTSFIQLSPVEFRLLNLLSSEPGRVCSRKQLMETISEDGRYVSQRAIDSHIADLEKKLVEATGLEHPIQSVYGVGYRIDLME